MFGIGVWEIVVIVLVALLVLGPEKLPDVARQLGRIMRDLKRTTNELQTTFQEAMLDEEERHRRERLRPEVMPAPGIEPRPALTALPKPGAPMPADVNRATASAAAPPPDTDRHEG